MEKQELGKQKTETTELHPVTAFERGRREAFERLNFEPLNLEP